MNRFNFLFAIALSSLAVSACASHPPSHSEKQNTCLENRGALDIGSGSTKAYVAVVDICQTPKRIVETVFDEKLKIGFGESLEKSPDQKIGDDVAKEAAVQIGALIEKMVSLTHPTQIKLVATAAFRKAKNGADVGEKIMAELNRRSSKGGPRNRIPITDGFRILSQEQEAEMGAKSALSNIKVDAASTQPIVVWDIGGGSMQMLAVKGSNAVFNGDLASVTFKNRVMREIQKKDPAKATTPNPLGDRQSSKAISLAEAHAVKNVPAQMKQLGPTARWIGIGGVLAISVQKQIEKEIANQTETRPFKQSALAKTLTVRSRLKDEEIESEYRTTEVTNLALVLGYMQTLKITQVETVEASLVQGLVTND